MNGRDTQERVMNKILVAFGTVLAAFTAVIFFAGRDASRRQAKIPATKAAALLAEAWADNRTRV